MGLPKRRGPNLAATNAAWSEAPACASRLSGSGGGHARTVRTTPCRNNEPNGRHRGRISGPGVARERDATRREPP
ncbi:hypothetical protein [Streptomyces longhuiensis]|uniref:hypothetical protein n=1 Tax=Streptomyces longhuiensis TaxID=2880933 RepID=UPI001D0A1124|nr:hypothetical protein [Streptomyces longhuiensis]UDL96927.1 hypothetical protein LGI35_00745 [Streptomyces longhuiensis]